MAWLTLIIGATLFFGGIIGQILFLRSRRQAHQEERRDQRRAGRIVLRIVATIVGAWMLIYGAANLLRGHGSVPPSSTSVVL
jgi:uncharacterized membrane protein YedE/YeeE